MKGLVCSRRKVPLHGRIQKGHPCRCGGKILIFRTSLLRTLTADLKVCKDPLGRSVPSAAWTRCARGLYQSGYDVVLCRCLGHCSLVALVQGWWVGAEGSMGAGPGGGHAGCSGWSPATEAGLNARATITPRCPLPTIFK